MAKSSRLTGFLFAVLAAFPAFAQERPSLPREEGVEVSAFVRIPLGITSSPRTQADFGIGLYRSGNCGWAPDRAGLGCYSGLNRGVELRATDGDRFGLWLRGPHDRQLLSFTAPLSADQQPAEPSAGKEKGKGLGVVGWTLIGVGA